MIDVHCHVDFNDFDEDRDKVILRAKDKLTAIINSGTGYEGNINALKLAEKNKGFIYPSLGFHPVSSTDKTEEDLKIAQEHIINNLDKLVAIGEVGMDYFYVKDKAQREKQKEIFTSFVEIANEYKVPLIIHGRDCERRIYNIVKDYEDISDIVFHCFSGSLKTAKRLLDSNYYMSFSTMLCFSPRHEDLVREIPLENILTETDSPFLAIKKEERNEPANVINAGKKIAEIQEIDFNTVDEVTTNNAKKIFNL